MNIVKHLQEHAALEAAHLGGLGQIMASAYRVWLAFGTSVTNKFGTGFNGTAGDYSNRRVSADSYLYWMCVACGLRPENIINKGVSGNTTALMVARLQADAIDYAASVDGYVFEPGPNDFNGGLDGTTTTASVTGNYATIIEAMRGTGKPVIVLTPTPTEFSTTAASLSRWQECCQWLRDNYADRDDVRVVDVAVALADPATGTPLSALYAPVAVESIRVHPSISGAQVMGRMIQQYAGDLILDQFDILASHGKNDLSELLPNPRIVGETVAGTTTPFFQAQGDFSGESGPDNCAVTTSGGTFGTATLEPVVSDGSTLPAAGGIRLTLAGASADMARAVLRFGSTNGVNSWTQVCRWDSAFANSAAVGVGEHKLLAADTTGILTCIQAGSTAASGTPAPTRFGERVTSGAAVFVWKKKPQPGDLVCLECDYEIESVSVGMAIKITGQLIRSDTTDGERFGYTLAGEFDVGASAPNGKPGLFMPRKGRLTSLPITLRDPGVVLRHVWADLEFICAAGGGAVVVIKNVNLRIL